MGDLAVEMQPDATLPSGRDLIVERRDGHHRLLAARRFAEGEVVLRLDGRLDATPDRYSIQVGVDAHLSVPPDATTDEIVAHHPWRFLNHACEPSAAFRAWELVSLRDLEPGDEITFDYETTEWAFADPFACSCGAPSCRREIRGFRFLPPDVARSLPDVAGHLRARTP